MTTTVLAYFPSPPRGVWYLGPIPIRAYALFIIAGIVVALLIGDRRWANRGGDRGVIYDIALWAVPFGLVGGRLYHLMTDWRTYFGNGGAGLSAALRIWDGGLGIWGAIALGGVGAWIGCRRRGIPLPAFADALAPGIVLAQAIGRLGNYFNQELFGRETTLPWGMEVFYRRDTTGFETVHSLDGVSTGQVALVVQPTFLYELLWNVLVFAVLIYVDRRLRIGHGRLFALYVAGYCVGRFCIELLRSDPATHIAGIRINSFTSTFVFIGAVVYIILAPKGREDPATLGGARGDEETLARSPVRVPDTELAAADGAAEGSATAKIAGQGEDKKPADTGETAETAETSALQSEAEEPAAEEPEAEEPAAEEAEEPAAEEAEEPEAEEAEEPEGEEPEGEEPEGEEPAGEEPEAEQAEQPAAEQAEEPAGEEPEGEEPAAEEPAAEQAEEPEAEEAEEPEAEQTEEAEAGQDTQTEETDAEAEAAGAEADAEADAAAAATAETGGDARPDEAAEAARSQNGGDEDHGAADDDADVSDADDDQGGAGEDSST